MIEENKDDPDFEEMMHLAKKRIQEMEADNKKLDQYQQ